MWADESIFYQIYPLGFCKAPTENDGVTVNRISKVLSLTEHLKETGVNAIYFSPVFQSDRHGYDTRDYKTVDCRLGSNSDFADVCTKLHSKSFSLKTMKTFSKISTILSINLRRLVLKLPKI